MNSSTVKYLQLPIFGISIHPFTAECFRAYQKFGYLHQNHKTNAQKIVLFPTSVHVVTAITKFRNKRLSNIAGLLLPKLLLVHPIYPCKIKFWNELMAPMNKLHIKNSPFAASLVFIPSFSHWMWREKKFTNTFTLNLEHPKMVLIISKLSKIIHTGQILVMQQLLTSLTYSITFNQEF